MTIPAPVLIRANELVNGARQKDYGPPKVNFDRIARIWAAVLGTEITHQQVIQCMIGLKLARLSETPDHEDSWLDIAGYVGVWDLCRDENQA